MRSCQELADGSRRSRSGFETKAGPGAANVRMWRAVRRPPLPATEADAIGLRLSARHPLGSSPRAGPSIEGKQHSPDASRIAATVSRARLFRSSCPDPRIVARGQACSGHPIGRWRGAQSPLDRRDKPGNDERKKGTNQGRAPRDEMKQPADNTLREDAMRFATDRLCLWRLCGKAPCLRARACRGDVRACSGLVHDWLAALEAEQTARPSFASMERQIETPAELRAYRLWRDALEASWRSA